MAFCHRVREKHVQGAAKWEEEMPPPPGWRRPRLLRQQTQRLWPPQGSSTEWLSPACQLHRDLPFNRVTKLRAGVPSPVSHGVSLPRARPAEHIQGTAGRFHGSLRGLQATLTFGGSSSTLREARSGVRLRGEASWEATRILRVVTTVQETFQKPGFRCRDPSSKGTLPKEVFRRPQPHYVS